CVGRGDVERASQSPFEVGGGIDDVAELLGGTLDPPFVGGIFGDQVEIEIFVSIYLLGREMEWSAAGDQNGEFRPGLQERVDMIGGVEQLLEVVENQQAGAGVQVVMGEGIGGCVAIGVDADL